MSEFENENDRIAKGLMSQKLDGYLPKADKVGGGDGPATPLSRAVRAYVRNSEAPPVVAYAPRESTLTRRDWVERTPALETPHVFSKPKADAALLEIRRAVRVEDGTAIYEREQWDKLVSEVVGMMLDCAEGAGLIVRDRAVGGMFRRMVGNLLQNDMLFWCDDDRMLRVQVKEKEVKRE